jgi:hypothetical protein
MTTRGFSSTVKICVLVLFAMSACLVPACKESSEQEQPAEQQTQASSESPIQQTPDSPQSLVSDPTPTTPEPPTPTPTEVSEVSTSGDTTGSELVPIDIELPKPMFVGTPQNIKVPNLQKPLGRPRPPFLAPVGTKNVASEKPISSSDEYPIIGELEMVTDGDKEAADGSYVELGPMLQQVTIDLGAKHDIYAIVVWHYHKQPVVYYDVVVQVADDPDFITNVKTVFNNDSDNSAGLGVGKDMHYTETAEGKLIDCLSQGVQGRHVRLHSNGNTANDLNHYIEVDVYGKPVE